MKAIYLDKFGSPDVLHLSEMVKPTPAENEVLVRVKATSVNYGDLAGRNFKNISPSEFNMPFLIWLMARIAFGLNTPNTHILGSEFSGIVETTGKSVTRFKLGDAVFGYLGQNMGAYAEYICIREDGVMALKPSNMTFEEAAVVPYGAIMALNLLRKVNVRPGQKVMIIGASGGIGSAAVQIAKALGANVTGICGTQRMEFVKALGADTVIDYTRQDYTRSAEQYDLIFDILGRGSIEECKKILKPGGIHLFASFKMKQILSMFFNSRSEKKVICSMAPGSLQDLMDVREMIEAGKIKAIIDKQFPMEKAAEAHRLVESGGKQGQVGISIG